MLTPQDDFIGHQLPTTFDHVGTSDPGWMERLWYTGHLVPSGEVIFDLGLGYHPNRNVMDGFAGVTVEGRQYNFRASRRLRPDALATKIGPLEIRVLGGLRHHRLVLEPNDSDLSFDLEFLARTQPHEEKHHFRRRQGRVVEDLARYSQGGRYRGWIQVAGKRFELEPATWWGQRDHSWGLRHEMRTDESSPPLTKWPPFFYTWAVLQFPQYTLHWFFNEREPGDFIYLTGERAPLIGAEPASRAELRSIEHELIWADDPHGQTLNSGRFRLTLENGEKLLVEVTARPGRYFLKGGLYGGLRGWHMGADRGPLYTEHDSWDLSDPGIRRLARTLSDHVIEARIEGETGYGIMEYGVAAGYPRYREAQAHPVF